MKRRKCEKCGRAQKVCLCSWLTEIDNRHAVLVLRHKSEVKHALNTVEILKNCLTNITVLDGEVFDEEKCLLPGFIPILLFPGEDAQKLEELPGQNEKVRYLFIVIDGTWKKARKIIYLNSFLQKLPKVELTLDKSRYILRKKAPEGFSTLEAVAGLLGQLEGDEEKFKPLYKALDQMMQFQIEAMGKEVFERHFSGRL